jgi:hypothetical protein
VAPLLYLLPSLRLIQQCSITLLYGKQGTIILCGIRY